MAVTKEMVNLTFKGANLLLTFKFKQKLQNSKTVICKKNDLSQYLKKLEKVKGF